MLRNGCEGCPFKMEGGIRLVIETNPPTLVSPQEVCKKTGKILMEAGSVGEPRFPESWQRRYEGEDYEGCVFFAQD
jgi:hypothetical protein